MVDKKDSSRKRNRAILTQNDMEWITDEVDLVRGQKRDARYRIRERTKSAIRDLALLSYYLDSKDRKMLFHSLFEEESATIATAMQFLLIGIEDIDEKYTLGENHLEAFVGAALNLAGQRKGEIRDPEVEIDLNIRSADTDDLIEKALEGNGTLGEYVYLFSSGSHIKLLQRVVDEDRTIVFDNEYEDDYVELTPRRAEAMLAEISEE